MEEYTFQKALIIIGDKKTKRVEILNQELKKYSSDEILVIKTRKDSVAMKKLFKMNNTKKVIVIKNLKQMEGARYYSIISTMRDFQPKYIFVTDELIDKKESGGSFTRRFDLIDL